ncbi:MAG: ABC transporter ATP-binding protein [Phycisphaerae bacterium]
MKLYRRALAFFRPDLGKIILSLVLIALMTLVGILWPVTIAIFINIAEGKTSNSWVYRPFAWVPRELTLNTVLMLAASMLVLRLAGEVLRSWQTQLSITIGYLGRTRVQEALFQKLQALSLKYHRSQPQGDAIYRLSYDTHGFQGILNVFTGALVNVLTLVFMLVAMVNMEWRLTLIALVVVPALYLTITRWGERLKRFNINQKEADASLTTQIQRSLSTIGLVQAFNRQTDESSRFGRTVRSYVDASLKLHWQEILYWLVLGVILTVGSAAIFAVGGYFVMTSDPNDPNAFAAGSLFLFLTYLGQLYDPLNKLTGSGAGLQAGAAGVERVIHVLDQDPIIQDKPGAIHLPVQPRRFALEHISFSYQPGKPVLRDVSVDIAPGSFVAFVGSSGVGKTTLLNLLPRFYDPDEGRLALDGQDLRDVKLADVRHHIALVLQENPILPATIAENIAYGRPDASDADIEQAAKLAGAHEFILNLDDAYDAMVSEQGTNLSGGQRQRIAIARALLTNAPILVLDEPTSALDATTEEQINRTLLSLKGKRTVIVVSHRLSTVLDCDRIFVMHEGQLVEEGTHTQLVERRGHYYQMARHQLRLEDAPASDAAVTTSHPSA